MRSLRNRLGGAPRWSQTKPGGDPEKKASDESTPPSVGARFHGPHLRTGGKTFWGGKEGFEFLVSIRSCIQYESGEACVGGLSSSPEKGYFSSYDVGAFAQGATDTTDTHDIFWDSPRTDITGREIVVHVAYSDLGLAPGQTLRMAIREADSTYDAESFFPKVVLTLK